MRSLAFLTRMDTLAPRRCAVPLARGEVTSKVRASAVAAAASTTPAPVYGFQPRPRVWRAERISTSATCSEASRGSICQASAATPETIGAAKLVPCP